MTNYFVSFKVNIYYLVLLKCTINNKKRKDSICVHSKK